MNRLQTLEMALEALDDRASLMKWQAARDTLRQQIALEKQQPADDYKALYEQMCERCDVLDKKLVEIENQWVGLTDEDKHHLNDVLNLQGRFPVIDTIEAKLKEKNT